MRRPPNRKEPKPADLAADPVVELPSSLAAAPVSEAPMRAALTEVLPSLEARAMKLCGNAADARDLVQDTVERALRFEHSYRRGTNLRAWMQQVLFSVFVTKCRRRKRERRALEVLTSDPCAWTHRDGPPAMQQLSPGVQRALDSLPEQFASVVYLVDLNERSYKDAAAVLDVPIGTVMSRLFRGRKLLAAALSEPELAAA